LGDASPAVEGLVALLGGTIAAGSHLTKTSTRAAANTSPEPFSNWALSIIEDIFVVGLGLVTLKFPLLAFGISLVLLLVMILAARWIWQLLRGSSAARPA